MLLRLIDVLFRDPIAFLTIIPVVLGPVIFALLLAITVHEFSHAFASDRLGDPTARSLGRLSLNPLAHLDPLGTLMLLVVGFGWGKPVPVNPNYLRHGDKAGMAMVSFAGPLSNLVTASLFALVVRFRMLPWHPQPYGLWDGRYILADLVGSIIILNIVLAIFNLIPIAPLDGFRVLAGIFPRGLYSSMLRLEQYGPAILLTLVAFDTFTRAGIFWGILRPGLDMATMVIVGRRFQ
ncbi:MAG: site-2 protease family protein [Chloroflexi bacterium]|nr:site-2 protease family protein [Chloroflexota bacterium]